MKRLCESQKISGWSSRAGRIWEILAKGRLMCLYEDTKVKAKRVWFKRSSRGAAIAYIGARRQETTPDGSVLTYRFVFETNSKFVDILAKLFQPKSNVGVLLVYGSPVGSAAASVGLAGSSWGGLGREDLCGAHGRVASTVFYVSGSPMFQLSRVVG